jgi:hypothetical protein
MLFFMRFNNYLIPDFKKKVTFFTKNFRIFLLKNIILFIINIIILYIFFL